MSRKAGLWQRLAIALAARLGYLLVYLIGRSMRWQAVGLEHLDAIYRSGRRAIFTFWHNCIFPATWFWRNRSILVMTSMNFDGEYIARIIWGHGYGAARGSSSRGATRALLEMAEWLRQGRDVAFTVDGPRGPRYLAKPGPVFLAKKTGAAIFCFHISMKWKIELKSWDRFQIPLPLSRAVVLMAPPIYVPPDADDELIRSKHEEMQATLDKLRRAGDDWWKEPRPAKHEPP